MQTAIQTNTTSIPFTAAAARYRIHATECDIRALMAVRETDPDTIPRTEETLRGLIVKQARYRRHVRQLEKKMMTEVSV
jgi:hypothetical protein